MENKSLKKFESVYKSLSSNEQELINENGYTYLFSKADLFLKVGAEVYRKNDFYHQPSTNDILELEVLKDGCKQVLECRGLTDTRAFTNLDVRGFAQLMNLFHYESSQRKSKYNFELGGQKGILDAITFIHVVDGNELTLYNFCRK